MCYNSVQMLVDLLLATVPIGLMLLLLNLKNFIEIAIFNDACQLTLTLDSGIIYKNLQNRKNYSFVTGV